MQKQLFVDSLNSEVILARRRGTRNMRLSIRSDGKVRLSIPYGVSEKQAQKFLNQKSDWIKKHQKPSILLKDGDHIGKSYRLVIIKDKKAAKPRTRLKRNEIHVIIPENEDVSSAENQLIMKKAADRALTKEAELLLPQRLQTLSEKTNLEYISVKIKKLKSRWGSCDSHKNITLNSYLTQLDWSLIDYVLIHELTHTEHPHHQKDFWDHLSQFVPDYKEKRKELKNKPTDIHPTNY